MEIKWNFEKDPFAERKIKRKQINLPGAAFFCFCCFFQKFWLEWYIFFLPPQPGTKWNKESEKRTGVGHSHRQGQTQRENYLERERKRERKVWLNQRSPAKNSLLCLFCCFPPVISDVPLADIQMLQVCNRISLVGRSSQVIYFNHIRVVSIPQQLQLQLLKKKKNQFSVRCYEQAEIKYKPARWANWNACVRHCVNKHPWDNGV